MYSRDFEPDFSASSDLTIEAKSQSTLRFDLIVKFFNKFASVKGRERQSLIRTFIGLLFKENRNADFTYNILRLILPGYDRDRGNYGVKEKSLATILKDSLGLTQYEFEQLRHYKNPSYHHGSSLGVGDFPTIVFNICQKYCKKDSIITVFEVNYILDELVKKSELPEQVATFTRFLKICTPEYMRWIVRIILKDLKLGIKCYGILKEYHCDAQDFYNLTNSLKEVCKKFVDKKTSLKDELMLFQPIKPMLAGKKPLQFFDILDKEYLLYTKFDGYRLQVHMNGNEIKMFSRNGKDYTHIYKYLIPILKTNIHADACILDGYVIVLYKNTLNMVPFGMNKQVALDKEKTVSDTMQLCYKIFDTLWLRHENEEANLLGFALRKRKHIMYKFIKPIKGKLYIVSGYIVKGTEIITKRFFYSIDRNYEGIILKDPESLYIPTDRSINWIKLKGDYVDGLTDTLDLLIIGGYYGEASYRTGSDWTDKITTFLLGVITHLDKNNPRATHVIPFCKVGTGYSETSLNDLRQKLRKFWVKNDNRKPSYIVGNWKPKLDDKPDCFIDLPNNSVVLYVKAAYMIKSDAFAAYKTLRFPRVVKIRYDKDWHEALNFEYLKKLMSDEYTKGMKKRKAKSENGSDHEEPDEGKAQTEKTKKRNGREPKKGMEVLEWFKGVEINQTDIVTNIFDGQEFMVLSLAKYEEKPILERKILQNGGIVVQNPLQTTKFIICDKLDFKFRALAFNNAYQCIFIKPSYINSCIAASKILPLSPVYLTMIPRDRAEYFNSRFDIFGDSYSEFLGMGELDLLLYEMEVYEQRVDPELIKKISTKVNLKIAYTQNLSMEDRVNLRMRGYTLVDNMNDKVMEVIVSRNSQTTAMISQMVRARNNYLKVSYIEDLRKQMHFEF